VALANFYPFAPGEVIGPHWSESDLYLPATNGKGVVEIGPKSYALCQGQLLHVPWKAPIRYCADARDPFVLIGLHLCYLPWPQSAAPLRHSSQRCDLSSASLPAPPTPQAFRAPFVITLAPHSELIDIASRIATTFERASARAPLHLADRDALLRALAMEFIVGLRQERRHTALSGTHPQARMVREMTSWMELSFRRPIRRAELAQRAGVSESSLAAAFRAVTGRSPIDYLIDLRLSHACALLNSSRQRVVEIAEQVGIPDVYYFSKLFKRRQGISPLNFRKLRSLYTARVF
jgi:AraC-like DNA-binding protein